MEKIKGLIPFSYVPNYETNTERLESFINDDRRRESKNIVAIFNLSKKATYQHAIKDGVDWYKEHNKICKRIAKDTKVTFLSAVGVFSGLSPNNKLPQNIKNAFDLCEASKTKTMYSVKVSTFNTNKEKAIKILESNKPNTKTIKSIIKGKKVQAFYDCLAYVDSNEDTVCIDGHAKAIAVGRKFALSTQDSNITPKQYDHLVDCYKDATKKINKQNGTNYLPYQIQAITWVIWRELHGIA